MPNRPTAQSKLPAKAKRSAKDKLLDAAVHVVRQKGYAATSVDDLCKAAGVTKGAFFHHFESKEALAVAAAQYWNDFTSAFFRSAPYHAHKDPLDRVLGYIDFRRQIIQGSLQDYTCLLGTMVQEAYDTSPRIREACDAAISNHAAVDRAGTSRPPRSCTLRKRNGAPRSSRFSPRLSCRAPSSWRKPRHGPELAESSILHLRRYIEFLFGRTPTTH